MNTDLKILNTLRSDDLLERNKALESVYKDYYPVIESLIVKNNGNLYEAEDIFQDVIIVLYNKVRNKEFELTSSLKTYLYSVARNLWLNKLKVKGKSNLVELDKKALELPFEETESLFVSTKQKEIMIQFSKIPEKCKEILYHFYFHRRSMNAIAESMGYANSQVAKNKKSRCLKKLKYLVFETKN